MSTWIQEDYIQAYRFAAEAHSGETYLGTNLPYLMHLSFVCLEVISALHFETKKNETLGIQCALLHDVIKDTKTGPDDSSRVGSSKPLFAKAITRQN